MTMLGEFRQKYPDYADMSDQQLAESLHKKFYSDVPRSQYYSKLGMKPPPMSWSEVGTSAVSNIPSSGVKLAKDLAAPIMHPIDTAKSIGGLALGGLEKGYEGYGGGAVARTGLAAINPVQRAYNMMRDFGLVSDTGHGKNVEAVGEFLKDRYGGIENIKQTLAEDPVGVIGDASMVLTGGGGAAVRAPALASKLARVAGTGSRLAGGIERAGEIVARGGELAQKAGQAIDPVHTAVVKPLKAGAEAVGGLFTHTGGEPMRIAARAGAEGGPLQLPWKSAPAGQAFLKNLRGQAPLEETVQAANEGLRNIREARGDVYRQSMAKLAQDKTILSFNDLDTALTAGKTTFKGVETNPAAGAVRKQMWDAVEEWRNLQASEYHTAEGFDALKQKLGAIRDSTEYGTKARVVADDIYHAARKTIMRQAPEYGQIMGAYEKASKEIKELEKTLSLKPNAAIYTKLRKLQASLRDNVNTSFGRHREMADLLVRAGAPHLLERLAGQAMKPWAPRGLAKLGAEIMAIKGGLASAPMLGMSSPRLMGETAYKVGQASRYLPPPRTLSAQPGRIADAASPREQVQEEAKDALKDRTLKKPDREALRAATRSDAKVDAVMRAKSIMDRIEAGHQAASGGGRSIPRITVPVPARPRPEYGGVQ